VRRQAGTLLAIATAVLLGGQPIAAQTTPPEREPPKSATPWNAATARPPPAPPANDSTLSLRVYDRLNSSNVLPYRPRQPDDPAYAVDVSAIMSRCDDGRLVITALLIGGHVTPLDNHCNTGSGIQSGAPAPPCNAATWTCASRPEN
jgi:hypothetical protein